MSEDKVGDMKDSSSSPGFAHSASKISPETSSSPDTHTTHKDTSYPTHPPPSVNDSSITIRVEDVDAVDPRRTSRLRVDTYCCPPHCLCWYSIRRGTGVSKRWKRYDAWFGRVGFGAKGLVYAFIGGMTCASASDLHEEGEFDESPQGAFVLIGQFPAGPALLVCMLLALWCYAIWRLWECVTFQGADATFGKYRNFFAYRLSPFVSACVYLAYSYYVIEILINQLRALEPSAFPNSWRTTRVRRAGLFVIGIAFAIACVIQLQGAFTRKWHYEMNWSKCKTKYERWLLLITGHVGYLGRAGIFLFVSVLVFKALGSEPVQQAQNTVSSGLNLLSDSGVGKVFMMIIGIMTATYGFYAILCIYYRNFPTPPPSGRSRRATQT
ncbi:hypothetical protein BC832DRAFT_385904 [Gaertneriomyces semiglobifer]|nr:hypothetical protein BC832DRAFT_385904 [Gaertneriomyces semiglobifer]